ncbi:MAG TPA: SPFH domain-containing protein [Candidatus Paceibacterota bacterium]|nr:SPFH domain-containing protein [Candidatus Paceibacterota bacterium]
MYKYRPEQFLDINYGAAKILSRLQKFYLGSLIVFLAISFLGGFLWFLGVQAGQVILGINIAYFASSLRIVKPDQVGALIVLGYSISSLQRGLHFAPFFISDFPTEPLPVIEEEFPGEPERVWHEDAPIPTIPEINRFGKMVPYYVYPVRVTTGRPDYGNEGGGASTGNPLDIQGTVEPVFFVRFQVKSHEYLEKFIPNIGTLYEVVRQIQDTMVRVLTSQFSQRTIQKIIEDIDQINTELQKKIEEITGDWGIEVRDAYIKTVGLSHTLNTALRDVGVEKTKALATIIAAEAEKKKLIEEGTGNAKARELLLQGEGAGIKSIADALQIQQGEVMELIRTKAAQDALKEIDHLNMFTGNMQGLPGLFGLADALKNRGTSE